MDVFTNRELAIIIWTGILLIVLLIKKQIRASIFSVIKSALNPKILAYFLSFLVYFSLVLYFFYDLGYWNLSNLKDSIIWFIFSGLPIGFIAATGKMKNGFWKSLIVKNLKLTVLVEFIVNLFTFSLLFELIIVPIITFIALLNTFSKHYKEHKCVERLTNSILAALGFLILFYTLGRAITEYNSIGNLSTLKIFLLPIVYSIISIPYMYIFTLYVEYEKIFLRLKLGKKRSRRLNFLIKLRLLVFCNIQTKKLQVAANMSNYNLMSISSEDEIDVMIRRYKEALSRNTTHNSEMTKNLYRSR